jgi:probable rRNA maturation factor
MIFLKLENEPGFPANLLENAARVTLELSAVQDADLTLVLTGDEQVQALNREFLDINQPTDVLSFPAEETDPETGRAYLGDIVISLQRAAEQAETNGHAVEAEVQLLVVHGVLHLLGHDHAEDVEKTRMWALQAEALASLGVILGIPEE